MKKRILFLAHVDINQKGGAGLATLAFYNAKDVPHINKNDVPEFVSEVKFCSNLTHLVDIRESHAGFDCSDSNLFRNL